MRLQLITITTEYFPTKQNEVMKNTQAFIVFHEQLI